MSDEPKLSFVSMSRADFLRQFIAGGEEIERRTGVALDASTLRLKGQGRNMNENRPGGPRDYPPAPHPFTSCGASASPSPLRSLPQRRLAPDVAREVGSSWRAYCYGASPPRRCADRSPAGAQTREQRVLPQHRVPLLLDAGHFISSAALPPRGRPGQRTSRPPPRARGGWRLGRPSEARACPPRSP